MLAKKIPLAAAVFFLLFFPRAWADLNPSLDGIGTSTAAFSWTDESTGDYIVALSTKSDFSLNIASGALIGTTTSYVNLSTNTLHYFKVKVSTKSDIFYESTSAVTYAAPPLNLSFQSSFFTASSSNSAVISVYWDTNQNPDYTTYITEISTESLPNLNPGNIVLTEPLPPVAVGSLKANTTYWVRVRAENIPGVPTGFTSPLSTSTLAVQPVITEELIYETSATVKWNPVNGALQEESCEGYTGVLSTSPIFSPLWGAPEYMPDNNTSSFTAVGLWRNTTYYYKVGSLNWNDAPNHMNIRPATTLAREPQNFSLLSISSTNASLGWAAFPSLPVEDSAQGYRLEASSAAFSGGAVISSTTYEISASTLSLSALMANTSHYFRVASLNQAGSPNYSQVITSTTLSMPLTKDLVWAGSSSKTITADFLPLASSPPEYSCEGYIFQASTSPFSAPGTIYFSSTPLSSDNSLTIEGLWPNTTYYLRIGSLNLGGTPNYIDLGTKLTATPEPLPSVILENVWLSSASVSFQSVASDGYAVQASTYRYFNYISSENSTANPSATSLSVGGLDANTLYYFRAGPVFNGTTVYTLSTPEYKATLSQPLGSAQVQSVYHSSAAASWTALPPSPQSASAEGYVFEISTAPGFSVYYSSRTSILSDNDLSIENLVPNTTYYLRGASLNIENVPNYVFIQSTATLANDPIQTGFTELTTEDMRINWDPNSNPPDTLYVAEISPNSDFSAPLYSSSTLNSWAKFGGLNPNTTYYPRVKSINRFNISGPEIIFSSMATLAYDPIYAAFSGLGVSSVTLNWGNGSNPPPPGTLYIAQISSVPGFGYPVLSSTTKNTSAYFSGLIPNASYYLRVSAYNHTLVPTSPTSLGTALTYPTTPYALPSTATFSNFMTDGFTLNWQSNGNSSFTVYEAEVSTMNDFSVLASSGSTLNVYFTFTGLRLDTTYWARVRAMGQSGMKTDFVNLYLTKTLLNAEGNILYAEDSLVSLHTSYGDITVFAPFGAFGGSIRLSIEPVFSFAPPVCAVASLKETGVGVSIDYSPKILMLKPLTITLPYKSSDMPDGTDETRLVIAYYDESDKVWVPLPSAPDAANNRVVAETRHLSVFQLMEIAPSSSMNSIKIYPNPYRPSSELSVMNFVLPPGSKIKIYTFNGELVRKIKAKDDGTAYWDGTNKSGMDAASGVYIALIEAPGKRQKIFKLAVER